MKNKHPWSPAEKKTCLPYLELPVPVKEELASYPFPPQFSVLGPEKVPGPCYRLFFTTQTESTGLDPTTSTSPSMESLLPAPTELARWSSRMVAIGFSLGCSTEV